MVVVYCNLFLIDHCQFFICSLPKKLNICCFQIALGGCYSRDFFNRYGDLRHIRRLRFWPLNKVLTEKYDFSEQEANNMTDFLLPLLDFVPEKRPTAAQCLQHPWFSAGPFTLEPSLTAVKQDDAIEGEISEKMQREKAEQEAVEVGMGNMAIDGNPKPLKEFQSMKPSE